MDKEIINGLIYTKFDPRIGPKAFISVPADLSEEIKSLISVKSLTIFSGEKDAIPKSLAMIPFPSLDMKGLTKCLRIVDETQRGGIIDCAITLIFDEGNDIIFYKYMKNFEAIFKEATDNIIKLEDLKADKVKISKQIDKLYIDLIKILNELRDGEILSQEKEVLKKIINEENVNNYRFKIIVCGDISVGKTSIVMSFTDNIFARSYKPTIGVNVCEKQVLYENNKIQFLIWDIAGHSRFETMRKHFYIGTNGIFLVFDLTNIESFHNLSVWYQDIKKHIKNNIHGIIIGNKKDLKDQRKLKKEEILQYAKKINFEYIETSALTGENIEEAFSKIGKELSKFS